MAKRLPSHYHPSLKQLLGSIGDKYESLHLVRPNPYVYQSGRWIFLMFVCIVIGLASVPWLQTSYGTGTVVPYLPSERLQQIKTPVKGVVSRWYVVEGDFVKKGAKIAEISDVDPNLMQRLNRQYEAAEMAVKAAEVAVETSGKNVKRQERLAAQGLKSQRDFELAQLEYQTFLSKLASKQKDFTQIQVKLARQASQVITAPRAGTIMRIFSPQGGVILKEGDKLATIAPKTDLRVVELFIPGNDLPLVEVGRMARLQFEGWPAVQFSGWPSVAIGTFGGRVKNIDPSDNGKGLFRVLIEPDPNAGSWPSTHYLRQGVKVKGWILLDTVTAGYELWRQFNAFPEVIRKREKKESTLASELGKQVGKLGK